MKAKRNKFLNESVITVLITAILFSTTLVGLLGVSDGKNIETGENSDVIFSQGVDLNNQTTAMLRINNFSTGFSKIVKINGKIRQQAQMPAETAVQNVDKPFQELGPANLNIYSQVAIAFSPLII